LVNNATATPLRDGNVTVLDPLAQQARECFKQQAAAIEALGSRVHRSFGLAIRLMHSVQGHVVVSGIGKSGHVGKKLAATFASTGTPSFFLHSTEALHGELGALTQNDVVLLISYSGETQEVVELLPHLQDRGIPTIALVGNPGSTLARKADVFLDVSVDREICPNNLAPTSSTLATLAMGDALAVCLMRMRAFATEDFARLHPGGRLGRRLRCKVRNVASPVPTIPRTATARDCILSLTRSHVHVLVVEDRGRPCGIVTDKELSRVLHTSDLALDVPVAEVMSPDLPTIDGEILIEEAELRMMQHGLDALLVTDKHGKICGVLTAGSER
jgi:arabinose-5-phosphate isomerase